VRKKLQKEKRQREARTTQTEWDVAAVTVAGSGDLGDGRNKKRQ
jgi:hypothetical protein